MAPGSISGLSSKGAGEGRLALYCSEGARSERKLHVLLGNQPVKRKGIILRMKGTCKVAEGRAKARENWAFTLVPNYIRRLFPFPNPESRRCLTSSAIDVRKLCFSDHF